MARKSSNRPGAACSHPASMSRAWDGAEIGSRRHRSIPEGSFNEAAPGMAREISTSLFTPRRARTASMSRAWDGAEMG